MAAAGPLLPQRWFGGAGGGGPTGRGRAGAAWGLAGPPRRPRRRRPGPEQALVAAGIFFNSSALPFFLPRRWRWGWPGLPGRPIHGPGDQIRNPSDWIRLAMAGRRGGWRRRPELVQARGGGDRALSFSSARPLPSRRSICARPAVAAAAMRLLPAACCLVRPWRWPARAAEEDRGGGVCGAAGFVDESGAPGQGRRPQWWGMLLVAARGGRQRRRQVPVPTLVVSDGHDVRQCYASGGGARSGSTICPDGGGGGRRSCAAAAGSRRVDAPLMVLLWGGRTTARMVLVAGGQGSGFLARRSC
jgi:hypothetical protein